MEDITIAAKLTFSKKDFDKAKALLTYSLADEPSEMPNDDFFFTGEPRNLNMSNLMIGADPGADQMCLVLMLFMVADAEEVKKKIKK